MLARCQVLQMKRADGLAVQRGDADPEAEEHALDLVMQPFVDGEAATRFC